MPLSHFDCAASNIHLSDSTHLGQTPASTWSQSQAQTQLRLEATCALAGRKRSRDEAAFNEDDDANLLVQSTLSRQTQHEYDSIYGESKTSIQSRGFIKDEGSQTDTGMEETMSNPNLEAPATQERPAIRIYKSQRLDMSTSNRFVDTARFDNSTLGSSSSKSAAMEPTIDNFTIHLGIGWSCINNDEHIQAAARGWAKYIENHYPLDGAKIQLQSKGLASYLVETSTGWYLFSDDLKQGRLVSKSLEKAFENLRTTPPIFESPETLIATARTPLLDAGSDNNNSVGASLVSTGDIHNRISSSVMSMVNTGASFSNGPTGQSLEVEMDMN